MFYTANILVYRHPVIYFFNIKRLTFFFGEQNLKNTMKSLTKVSKVSVSRIAFYLCFFVWSASMSYDFPRGYHAKSTSCGNFIGNSLLSTGTVVLSSNVSLVLGIPSTFVLIFPSLLI